MTLQRKRLFGLSTAFLASLTVVSFGWAQTAPPEINASVSCGGLDGSTAIDITAWSGGIPSQIRITVPGQDPATEDIAAATYQSSSWTEDYTDPQGWTHGSVSILTNGNPNLVYQVQYHETTGQSGRQLNFDYQLVGNPNQTGHVVVSIPDWNWPDNIIIIIIIIVVLGCALAHGLATLACSTAARIGCGASGVKHAEFSGWCGVGNCTYDCK